MTSSSLLRPSAGDFYPCSRHDRRESVGVTYCLPPPPAHVQASREFELSCSHHSGHPSATALGTTHRMEWQRGELQAGTPCSQTSQGTAALRAGLPNAEMPHKSIMNPVEINLLSDLQLEILIWKQRLTIPGKGAQRRIKMAKDCY